MQHYADGNYAAFEALYARHKAPVLRFYRRQVGESGEELLQEAFMRLINARSRYTASASFKTYLWTLVRSVLVDHYRKQQRSLPRSYDGGESEQIIADERIEPDTCAEQNRQLQQLLRLIGQLPSAQREAFLLKEESGLSLTEIAQITAVSIDTIKSRLRYAVTKLRAGMEAL